MPERTRNPSGPSERAIVQRIVKALRERDWFVLKTHGGPLQMAGLPDLLCLKKDRMTTWIEVKKPGERATKLQEAMMAKLRATGCVATVVHSVEEALKAVEPS